MSIRVWTPHLLRAYLLAVTMFVAAPLLSLMLFSFQEDKVPSLPIRALSLRWYHVAWHTDALHEGLLNSVKVGVTVAIGSTLLGFISARSLSRAGFRAKLAYAALITIPALVPILLSAIALLMYFERIHISGTLAAISIAHICYSSPFAMVLIHRAHERLNVETELAARNLGAKDLQVTLQVVAPQLWPTLLASALLCFLLSWDEFIIAWFLGGFRQTLPVVTYTMMGGSLNPSLNAVGTCAVLVSGFLISVVLLLQQRFFGNRGYRIR